MRINAALPPDYLRKVARPGTEDAPIQHLDVRDDQVTVLKAVDRLLKVHGLEIVRFGTPPDEFMFSIGPRSERDRHEG